MAEDSQPPPSPAEPLAPPLPRLNALYHYTRLQFPALALPRSAFDRHLGRSFQTFKNKTEHERDEGEIASPMTSLTWDTFCDGLYVLDWTVAIGCLEGRNVAWELLFNARTGRSDVLLVDALRARAVRLYPRSEEQRETAVNEFWSHLLVPDSEGSIPVLARYDGQRPLAPWLIRVFQNRHLSKLRVAPGPTSLPEDDQTMPMPAPPREDTRWHEAFIVAARSWLHGMEDQERLLLGLRWRYKLSQREVAAKLGVHEGTISRQTDKLRDHALEVIGTQLRLEGWAGDDLETFILSELGAVLNDDPRLSADALLKLLQHRKTASHPEIA